MTDNHPKATAESLVPALGAYATPKLVVYGSLAEITQKVGRTSNRDGGSWPKNRSQP